MKNNKVTDRMNEVCGFKTDKELAQLLGLKAQNFSNRKRKGTLTPEIIKKCSELHSDVNLDWLITGEGPKYKEKIKEPGRDYGLHGDWTPQADPQDWNMLGKTHKILTSNTVYKTALTANINAFYHAIETEDKLEDQNQKIHQLEDRIAALEKALEEKGEVASG